LIVMYSPRISEKLIPKLYQIAKAKGVPMTKIVDEILERELRKVEVTIRLKKIEVEKEAFVVCENLEDKDKILEPSQ